MKTTKKMNDAERKAAWAKVNDPVEALEELREHRSFLGDDPYYQEMDGALWEMVERVLKLSRPGSDNGASEPKIEPSQSKPAGNSGSSASLGVAATGPWCLHRPVARGLNPEWRLCRPGDDVEKGYELVEFNAAFTALILSSDEYQHPPPKSKSAVFYEVTAEVLSKSIEELRYLYYFWAPDLKDAANAPEWVSSWQGRYHIKVENERLSELYHARIHGYVPDLPPGGAWITYAGARKPQ